jgi:hypothetical protein
LRLPSAFAGEAEGALKAWLAEERIRFVEERDGSSRALKVVSRDAKKKMLLEASLGAGGGSFAIDLALGPKARLAPWLSRMSPRAARALAVRIAAIG